MTMTKMRITEALIAIAVTGMAAHAADLSADEIMARVAENQDRSFEARKNWVYKQSVLTRLHRTNGKLAREEDKEFTVAPTGKGIEKTLVRFAGKYERSGEFIPYDKPGHEYKDMDIDGELADELADELTSDRKARDGMAPQLFPLTRAEQGKYTFDLIGRERYKDHDVYKITFTPRRAGFDNSHSIWAGEVLVDAQEFQPVLITSYQARGIPAAVKVLLGTNVKGLGFKVHYTKIEDGVWFPASFGGEFSLRALFFYGRKISITMSNTGFQKTDVQSRLIEEPLLQ
jgi:hypothetical protein